MHTVLRLPFIWLVFSFISLPSMAKELDLSAAEKTWIKEHPVIQLGVDPQWPPFEYVNSRGKYEGMAADYMKLLGHRLGVHFEHVPRLSWPEVVEYAKVKKLDVLPAVMETKERSQYLVFSKPYLNFPMVIIVRKDSAIPNSLKMLEGKKVSVVKNYVTHEILSDKHPEIILRPADTVIKGLKDLSTGVVEAYVGNLASISFAVNQTGLTNLKVAATTPYSYPLSIAVRNDWTDFVPILQKAINSISSAELQAIQQKWIQVQFDRGVDLKTVLLVTLPLFAVVITFIAVSMFKNKRLKHEIAERQKSEKKYRRLFETANDSILILKDGLFADCNPMAIHMFGCQRGEIINRSPADFSPYFQSDEKVSRDKWQQKLSAAEAGVPQHFEWQYKKLDGKIFDADVILNSIEIDGGKFLQAIARDVTERKNAERELAYLLNEHESVTNNIPDLLYKTDNEGRFLWWNKGLEQATGLGYKDLYGQFTLKVIYEYDYPIVKSFISKVMEEGSATAEFRIVTVNGPVLYQIKSIALKDENGNIIGRTGVARDISQQRKLERALKTIAEGTSLYTGKDFFHALVENIAKTLGVRFSLVAELVNSEKQLIRTIAEWDNGGITEGTEYFLPDTPCANVVGKNICVYSKDIQSLFPKDKMLSELNMESYAGVPLIDSSGDALGIVVVLDDKPLEDELIVRSVISSFAVRASVELERIRTDAKLRQAAAVFENSDEGFMITDSENNILAVNRAFSEITGYSESEVIGKNPRFLQSDRQDSDFYKSMWQSLKVHDKWQGQIWNKRKNGDYYPEWLTVSIIKDEEGRIVNYVGVFSDITTRFEADEKQRQLQKQLQQAQKMEAIGHLAGGIAHDFNNILASILGYTDLAKSLKVVDKRGKLPEYLKEVTRAGERARDLVSQMLVFSRGRMQEERLSMPIGPVVSEAVKMLRPMLPSSIEINDNITDDILMANCNPIQLHQLIMNLCINARDAMQDKGRIDVSLSVVSKENRECSSCHNAFSGKFIEVAITDNGTGIDSEIMDQLFEPFFTTKEVGQGTGMGLSLVHGIIHDHDGHIVVESRPGKGSVFRVLFPYVEEATKAKGKPDLVIDLSEGKNQHILVVDDEEAIAGFMKILLEGYKYRVSVFTDCEQAMSIFLQDPRSYDLVITDQTMPVMTGEELAKSMLQVRPDLPIILCTGYSKHVSKKYAETIGVRAFMEKPIDSKDMVRTVNSLLN